MKKILNEEELEKAQGGTYLPLVTLQVIGISFLVIGTVTVNDQKDAPEADKGDFAMGRAIVR